ncbi:MAG: hypothetical protein NTX98_03850 [Candidatus Doudnabacteria bacterium]|nr:hypothetical protein [Candidatus Doudnabacteria bacterium]
MTLLIAIIVLSAILAITFSIATILMIEIRTSGDLLRTESAFYGADAVMEEALFKVKRNVSYWSGYGVERNLGNVKVDAPAEKLVADNIFQDSIPVMTPGNFYLSKRYPLYNPESPTVGGGYAKVKITNLSIETSQSLKVYICQFNPVVGNYQTAPCSVKTSEEYWIDLWGLLKGGTEDKYFTLNANNNSSWTLDPNRQQELVFVNESASPIWVQIEAFDSNLVLKPIPLVGETSVEINAVTGGVTRKIKVDIPSQ